MSADYERATLWSVRKSQTFSWGVAVEIVQCDHSVTYIKARHIM